MSEADVETERCWCGTENPYYAPFPRRCGGHGFTMCICGGDFCVCHWHGEIDCDGCEDCDGEEAPDYWPWQDEIQAEGA